MKLKVKESINLFGFIVAFLGAVLFVVAFAIEAMKMNPATFSVWHELIIVGDISMPLSIMFILAGLVLVSMDFISAADEQVYLDELKLRYVLGEITKQQYEVMKKNSDTSQKIMS